MRIILTRTRPHTEMHSIAKITNTTTIPIINTPKIKVIAKITKATKLMWDQLSGS